MADRSTSSSPAPGCVATMDADRRELAGGWVAITGGLVERASAPGRRRRPTDTIDATDCLVTPGLVNTHHHLFQNLTRAYPPMTDKPLFGWLQSLYPLWRGARHRGRLPLGVGRAGRAGAVAAARRRPTTSTSTRAAPATCSAPRSTPPATSACASTRPAARCRCRRRTAACRPTTSSPTTTTSSPPARRPCTATTTGRTGRWSAIALAPCSPFTVTEDLMVRSAELAERLDVRLHTHFAENAEDDEFSLATFGCRPTEYLERTGWLTDRAWLAHCVMPDADEVRRLGAAGVGVAHCPSSNLILASGIAPVVALRAAGVARRPRRRRLVVGRRGVAVAGGPPGDAAGQAARRRRRRRRPGWRWRWRRSAARRASAGPASSACSTPGAVGDVAVWSLTGPAFAGAIADPVEAWLRCGPVGARDTIVHGERRRPRRTARPPGRRRAPAPPTAGVAERIQRGLTARCRRGSARQTGRP